MRMFWIFRKQSTEQKKYFFCKTLTGESTIISLKSCTGGKY